jgi:hypothetical protein
MLGKLSTTELHLQSSFTSSQNELYLNELSDVEYKYSNKTNKHNTWNIIISDKLL